MLVTMCISLYTSRVILKVLGVEDYGIYNVVGGVVTLFTFINNSMTGATQRFLTIELGKGNLDKLKTIFSTAINIHAVISFIIFFISETVGLWFLVNKMTIPADRFVASICIYECAVFSTLILMLSVPYNALIVAHEKMDTFAYISVLEVLLKLLILLVIPIFQFDHLILYGIFLLLVQIVIRTIYQVYCIRNFKESKYEYVKDVGIVKSMLKFASWTLFGNVSYIALTQGVNILLNLFFGPAVNAARAIAVQVQGTIQNFASNFQTAVNPQIVKNFASNNTDYMTKLVFASSKYSFFLMWIFCLPIIFNTDYILGLWLGIVPGHTTAFIKIILIISLFDVLSNPLMTAINSTGKIKNYQIIVGSLQMIVLPLSYFFLKLGFQPECVFIVHVTLSVTAYCSRIILVHKHWNFSIVQYAIKVILPISIVAITSILFSSLLKRGCFVLANQSALFCLLLCFIVSLLSIVLFGINKDEKLLIRNYINSKIARI